jgi:acyl-CoA synthetase (AMP-forming)/AMP-acid ligase II
MIRAGLDIRTALLRRGRSPLLHDLSGGIRTGEQLVTNVDRLAGALRETNRKLDRIGLWYRNSLSAVEGYLAAEWLGATRVPVDPNASVQEAAATFDAADVGLVLSDDARSNSFNKPSLLHTDASQLTGDPFWPNISVADTKCAVLYPRSVSQNRLFAIPFSYRNWQAITRTNIHLYQSGYYGPWLGENECFLAAQQIMHGTGLVGTYPFLAMGLPQVIVDQFEPERIIDAIQRHKVTATMLVPVMLLRLAKAARMRQLEINSLAHVLYGGGPVTSDQLREALHSLGPVLVQLYGRMEGGWPISVLGIDEHRAIMEGRNDLAQSCGKPIENVEVKLITSGSEKRDCGELWVRSEMNVEEYTDANGWCSLGDIMRRDNEGYLYFAGRNDRMINTGYHVYPAEIEIAIAEHPEIHAVRVVGEVSAEYGQTIVAYIVLHNTTSNEEATVRLKKYLQGRLAKYKVPHVFRVVNERELPAI